MHTAVLPHQLEISETQKTILDYRHVHATHAKKQKQTAFDY